MIELLIIIKEVYMERSDLERMYLVEHKTMDQIGREYGVTRQGVYYYVKKYGIDSDKAENVDFKCDTCGKNSRVNRKRWIRSIKHFCGFECYKKYLGGKEYNQSRTGQRIGRSVMEKRLGRLLKFGEVVHHIDGNNNNNDVKNLMLFPNNSEHIKHHHKIRQSC
jgi:hypothetical protein